ncbi:hypothetical protein B0O99DRAFT_592345 [Bisporella sp. PMI_857]|nr:hypothetical protein B0O99DRAFT_592345 [Bisporella sp. PMI_857]
MPISLVFCTAQIPAEDFQTQSSLPTSVPEEPWIFQKTPDDSFMKDKLSPGMAESSSFGVDVSPDTFVVLDERTARDKTCVMYHLWRHVPEEDEGWDEDGVIEVWLEFRVKFAVAWLLAIGLCHDADMLVQTIRDPHRGSLDADGVWQLPMFENNAYELLTLKDGEGSSEKTKGKVA